MNKMFTLVALTSVTSISGLFSGSCASGNCGAGQYQNQQDSYYQQRGYSQGQAPQGYYEQRQAPQGYYDQRQASQGYYDQRQASQGSYDQRNDQNYQQRNDQNFQGNTQYDQQQPRQGQYDNRDQQRNSDQEIHKKIQDTLSSGWFSKGFQNVMFDVNNGNVNLRGSVDTLDDKNKVESSVRDIDGVRQVNNQITVTPDTTRSSGDSRNQYAQKYPQDTAANQQDRDLNAKIRDKLSGGWFSKGYETIVIKTTNGVVVLSGTVDRIEDGQKIANDIKAIEGVKSVNNQLTVKNR
jgi:osmotically-inducible protein OsmY